MGFTTFHKGFKFFLFISAIGAIVKQVLIAVTLHTVNSVSISRITYGSQAC